MLSSDIIYLDNAATTQPSREIQELYNKLTFECYFNTGSPYAKTEKYYLDEARKELAGKLDVDPEYIIFTSSGTEANNIAILGLEDYLRSQNKMHILSTEIEHKSVLEPLMKLSERGFEVELLPVHDGVIDPQEFENAITEHTGFASVMLMNNEIGTVNDVCKLAEICKKYDIIFHSDCVQGIDCTEVFEIDEASKRMITFSGHKFHAPKGSGCLVSSCKELLSPLNFGGQQEYSLRPGTINLPAIVTMCTMFPDREEREARHDYINKIGSLMCNYLQQYFNEMEIPYKMNNLSENRKVLSITIDGVEADTLIHFLAAADVYVSAGAACDSNSMNSSHVLKAIGLSDEEARRTIRISFSGMNILNDEKLNQGAKVIANATILLQSLGGVLSE